MINIHENEKSKCCGCGACAQICPTQCIQMEVDSEGFKYPKVSAEKCIGCNVCETVCPILQKEQYIKNDYKMKALGGWNKNEEVRMDSSSGGVFSLIAEYVLGKGGVVYGCTLNEQMKAVHIGVERVDELYKLRGSKYVQSDIQNVYSEIKEHLKNDRYVFFVGTPCQAAGLSSFLKKKYEKLFICDFICHGVPSPLVFEKYIEYLEKKNKSKVVGFRFRNKDKKWQPTGQQMGTAIFFENGTVKKNMPAYKDYYMNAFLDDVCLRPSCYDCSFKSVPKGYADFTIADFWGAGSIDEELCDGKGTSLVLVNSAHGENLMHELKDKFYYNEYELKQSLRRNHPLTKSAVANPNRERFFEDMKTMPFEKLAKKYMTAFTWASHKVIKILKALLKRR